MVVEAEMKKEAYYGCGGGAYCIGSGPHERFRWLLQLGL